VHVVELELSNTSLKDGLDRVRVVPKMFDIALAIQHVFQRRVGYIALAIIQPVFQRRVGWMCSNCLAISNTSLKDVLDIALATQQQSLRNLSLEDTLDETALGVGQRRVFGLQFGSRSWSL